MPDPGGVVQVSGRDSAVHPRLVSLVRSQVEYKLYLCSELRNSSTYLLWTFNIRFVIGADGPPLYFSYFLTGETSKEEIPYGRSIH